MQTSQILSLILVGIFLIHVIYFINRIRYKFKLFKLKIDDYKTDICYIRREIRALETRLGDVENQLKENRKNGFK